MHASPSTMKYRLLPLTACLVPGVFWAADLKPDLAQEIPAAAQRPVVVRLSAEEVARWRSQTLPATLPDGLVLRVAAAPPLVTHPLMGCFDDRGRLFVGDAVGLNWNKKQLEAHPPNRILMLEDTDGDGIYDKSTIFADQMTFPQGGCWLKGSLYVCSPPGLWKLTDTDGDGVADQREMIVSGFDYTGNAADVHGPWLHPNGRLYWCHGRKGHKVTGKDGVVVHEGLASGIWSCRPDGSDVQWHALGCMDNPVKVDFNSQGDILGVVNLYYNQPRGDCLIHWLYGGAYERADQIQALSGLPRTLEHMPVVHNFGHVAVSGCCFDRWGTLDPAWKDNLFVTHFNTQKVVRMELTPNGASYQAVEHEFLKLDDPDAHFTDAFEDSAGGLMVVNTGGWFRIGCPSSLMAKPDIQGAIYRVAKKEGPMLGKAGPSQLKSWKPAWQLSGEKEVLDQLKSTDPKGVAEACQWVAQQKPSPDGEIAAELLNLLRIPLDPALEHQVMYAELALGGKIPAFVDEVVDDTYGTRCLIIQSQAKGFGAVHLETAALAVGPKYPKLTEAVIRVAAGLSEGCDDLASTFTDWLASETISEERLRVTSEVAGDHLAQPKAQEILSAMLRHANPEVRRQALKVLAHQNAGVCHEAWLAPLDKILATSTPADLSLFLDATAKLKTPHFDAALQTLVSDEKRPQSLRLKALSALSRPGKVLDTAGFSLLVKLLSDPANITARVEAARLCSAISLTKEQLLTLGPILPTLGPLELQSMIRVTTRSKDPEVIKALATNLAKSPFLGAIEESTFKTLFAATLPEAYGILAPAIRAAAAASEEKKHKLEMLGSVVAKKGRPDEGRRLYESGRGTCIACHQIGDKGRAIGPNLSRIGQIRLERDILESILFPSNTLARDYEAHAIETSDGQTVLGIIKSHTAEGLLLVDISGLEHNVPHASIIANTTLTTSLMPPGLDQTLTEQELLDLVAWLRSLK